MSCKYLFFYREGEILTYYVRLDQLVAPWLADPESQVQTPG